MNGCSRYQQVKVLHSDALPRQIITNAPVFIKTILYSEYGKGISDKIHLVYMLFKVMAVVCAIGKFGKCDFTNAQFACIMLKHIIPHIILALKEGYQCVGIYKVSHIHNQSILATSLALPPLAFNIALASSSESSSFFQQPSNRNKAEFIVCVCFTVREDFISSFDSHLLSLSDSDKPCR